MLIIIFYITWNYLLYIVGMCDINGGFVDLNDSDDDSVASFATAASPEESKGIKCSELLPHEVSSLEQKLQRIVVIQQTDQSYHMAINDIRDQAIISVLVEPSFYGRHCNMNVIIIATANNTYVFDLKALGGIFPELLSLFNAEYPKKVMHYSHRVCDQLYHQHKLNVNGICDTFVALCVVRKDRSILSLRDAISLIFNIPMSELTCEEIDGVSININCYYYLILMYYVSSLFRLRSLNPNVILLLGLYQEDSYSTWPRLLYYNKNYTIDLYTETFALAYRKCLLN